MRNNNLLHSQTAAEVERKSMRQRFRRKVSKQWCTVSNSLFQALFTVSAAAILSQQVASEHGKDVNFIISFVGGEEELVLPFLIKKKWHFNQRLIIPGCTIVVHRQRHAGCLSLCSLLVFVQGAVCQDKADHVGVLPAESLG